MKYLLLILTLLFPFFAEAKDGQIGATSSGSSQITVIIPERIVLQKNNKTDEFKPGKGTTIQYEKQIVKDLKGNKVIIYMPKL